VQFQSRFVGTGCTILYCIGATFVVTKLKKSHT